MPTSFLVSDNQGRVVRSGVNPGRFAVFSAILGELPPGIKGEMVGRHLILTIEGKVADTYYFEEK